jgi:NAD(P)-dependent dehydrogenase (short-subunit alcohol dehydrogenase family)
MDITGFAIVTGSASGIGRACAKSFAREGAAGVALLDISVSALEEVKAEVEAILKSRSQNAKEKEKVAQVLTFAVDVRNEKDVDSAIASAAQTFGRIDYLVNCAGVAFKHPGGAAHAETADWARVLDINLNGTFYCLRAAARIMLKQDFLKSSM